MDNDVSNIEMEARKHFPDDQSLQHTFMNGWQQRGRFGIPFSEKDQPTLFKAYQTGIESRLYFDKENAKITAVKAQDFAESNAEANQEEAQ